MIQVPNLGWINNFHNSVMKSPLRFNHILEVSDFLEIERTWEPPHVLGWERLWDKEKRLQIIASVGHLKSNWVFLDIVKNLLNDIDEKILFGAESDDSSKDMVIRVKEALTSPPVVEEFGDLEGEIWSGKQLYIAGRTPMVKGANLFGVGVRSAVEGKRYGIGYLDDPIGLKKAISKAERKYAELWIDNQYWPRINWQMGGRLLVIGSFWGKLDIYHHIRDKHKVKTVIFPAHNKSYSKLLWPEIFTKASLIDMREHTPEPVWQLRYLCNDEGMSGKAFKPEWFQLIDKKDIPFNNLLINQTWDLAITEKEVRGTGQMVKSEPDFTAGLTGGIDLKTGNIYIFDLFLDRIIIGFEDMIERYYLKWPMTKTSYIETNQFQKLVYNLARARKSAVPVSSIGHYAKDKFTRISNIEPYFKSMRVYILKDIPHFDEFYQEYIMFPTEGEHDDIMDTVEMLIKSFTHGAISSMDEYSGGF